MQYKVFNSSDSNVKKFVFEMLFSENQMKDAVAEAVLYKYGSYEERTVICCSVMSGCPVGCTFCGTGSFYVRNLTANEIIEQVQLVMADSVIKEVNPDKIKKFQIMFMSMGEPFWNYIGLDGAIRRLHQLYPNAALLVSTSAPNTMYKMMPAFIELSQDIDKVGLQFSVHESTDEARAKLIPTKTSTLREIASLGEMWAAYVGRKPFYNYCVHEGNNTAEDAERLIKLFDPAVWETTLSVICEKDESVKNSIDRQLEIINGFNKLLLEKGASTRVFNPAGQDDIGGGCGQLWYFQDWLKTHSNVAEKC
jgi:23S rRNA (adenine2503-C2)-methyltransferase